MNNELQAVNQNDKLAIASRRGGEVTVYTPEKVELLKRTICKGATDDELALFVGVCNRTGLDPFTKQIHAIKRWDAKEKREVMTVQTGIDGFRLVAERTGEMDGQEGPLWCGADGVWHDIWMGPGTPFAAKVIVFRKGHSKPYVGQVKYSQSVQLKSDGKPNVFWTRMPDHMLGKCAEAQALRKAFPQELGGLYAKEEGDKLQDDSGPAAPPEKRLMGMEEDPDLITLDHWNHIKAALVASGGTQGELLAHAGVERPGQIRREQFDDLLKLARTPRKDWPRPGLSPTSTAPEKPKNGGASAPNGSGPPQKPANGGAATQPRTEPPLTSAPPPLPVTMQQLDELRKQIKRVGASDMEVFAFLQTHGCSKLDELDEDMAEWILAELREQQDAREPGSEG